MLLCILALYACTDIIVDDYDVQPAPDSIIVLSQNEDVFCDGEFDPFDSFFPGIIQLHDLL